MTHFRFLSSYPPTRCGLATFTQALASALTESGADTADVVRVLDAAEQWTVRPPGVCAEYIADDRHSLRQSISALNASDVAIIQHEYGIYGGPDGEQILDLLVAVSSPMVVVLHTVLAHPTPRQRGTLSRVCSLASRIVVMTRNAHDLLISEYGVDPSRVHVIPHGVNRQSGEPHAVRPGKRILTWGLISPGKGIEWGIRALARLGDIGTPVQYVIAGQTHPKVLAHSGESYRHMLGALARELSVDADVHFEGRYLDTGQLAQLVATADVVLLPYEARDQATSGVLAEAVAAGIPVVATRFPHAVELLAQGAGIVVAHDDADAMAAALRRVLTNGEAAARMRANALRESQDASWGSVAHRYVDLVTTLRNRRAA